MIEPVCRTCEVPRNCGCVVRAVFLAEVFVAGIYSSVISCGSMVLRNAIGEYKTEQFPTLAEYEEALRRWDGPI